MGNTREVRYRVVGDTRDFDRNIEKSTGVWGNFEKALGNAFKNATPAAAAMTVIGTGAAAAAAGVALVTKEVVELAQRGSVVKGVEQAFNGLATRVNQDAQAIMRETRAMSQGLVSDMDIMANANKGLLLGLPITAQEMGVLSQTAIALGKAMQVGPQQALQDLVTGLGRGSAAILDNLGITVKAEEAYERYAATLGKKVSALTEAEKKTAIYNSAMVAAKAATEAVGGVTLQTADHVGRMDVAWQNARDTLGAAIVESEGLNTAVADLADTVVEFAEALQQHKPEVTAFFDTMVAGLRGAVREAKELVSTLDTHIIDDLERLFGRRRGFGGQGEGDLSRIFGGGAGAGLLTGASSFVLDRLFPGLGSGGTTFLQEVMNRAEQRRIEDEVMAEIGRGITNPPRSSADESRPGRLPLTGDVMRRAIFGSLFPSASPFGPGGQLRVPGYSDTLPDTSGGKPDIMPPLAFSGRGFGLRLPGFTDSGPEPTKKVRAETVEWDRILNQVANTFQLLGVNSDSTMGRIAGSIALGVSGWASYKDMLQRVDAVSDESAKKAIRNTHAMVSAIQAAATAVSIWQGNQRNMSGAGAALGGAAQGAAAGAAFGPYGIVIGAVAGGLLGYFAGADFRAAAKKAGQVLGVEVSKELANAIADTMERMQVTSTTAALLNLDKAMAGKDPRQFTAQMRQLLMLSQGQGATSSAAAGQFSSAFQSLLQTTMREGPFGRALTQMVTAGRSQRNVPPEVAAFAAQQFDRVGGAAIGLVENFEVRTEADARALGGVFSKAFWETVKEKGIIAASDAFRETFHKLIESLQAAGVSVPSGFGDMGRLLDLGANEEFRKLAEAARFAAEALEGFANLGFLDVGVQGDLGHIIAETFRRATQVEGATEKDALMIVMRDLAAFIRASNEFGLLIPPEIAEIIAKAQKEGLVLPISIAERQLDMQRQIRDAVLGIRTMGMPQGGGTPRPGGSGTGSTSGGGDDVSGADPGHDPKKPKDQGKGNEIVGFALGGHVDAMSSFKTPGLPGKVIRVAETEGETIIPDSKIGSFLAALQGGLGPGAAAGVAAGTGSTRTSIGGVSVGVNFSPTASITIQGDATPEAADRTAMQVVRAMRQNTAGLGSEVERRVLGVLRRRGLTV